ncbi:MAG: hypothetical protein FWJ87_05010 [Micromonosporaceae bacterium]
MRQRGLDVSVHTTPPPLDPDLRARVHAWLRRHGRPTEGLHPLTERRYAARYRAYRTEMGAVWAAAGVVAATVVWQLVTRETPGTATTLAWFVAAYLVLAGGSLLGLRRQRLADRTTAAAVPERVARPVAVGPRELLGGWLLLAAAVAYPGAVVVGVAALVAADRSADRATAVAFLVAVAFFAGYAAAVLADALRRPTLATDRRTLSDDEALRREDAGLAVAPYLAVLALVAGVGTAPGSWLLWLYLGYAAAAAVTWAAWQRAQRRAATAATDRTVS